MLLIGGTLGIIFSIYPRASESVRTNPTPEVKVKIAEVEVPSTSQIRSFIPTKIRIEKLDVNASIESVGMDKEGRMDVPQDPDNAAWYTLGFKPGDMGSAVIAAHFDKPDGSPAVFAELTTLTSGDTITVEDSEGKELTYTVQSTATYPFDAFPLQKVFNTTSSRGLNLITCDGTWDKSKKSYSNRFVVYSKLKE